MHGNNAIVPTRQVSSTSQAERLCRLNPVYQEWQILSSHPFKRHGKMILKWFKSWKRYSLELKFIESFVSSNDLQVDTNSKIWSQPLSNFVSRTTSPRVSVFNSTLFTGTAEWSSLTNVTNSCDNVESRLETNKLRNIGKFFAHLLYTDRLAGSEMWADNPAFSQAMK